MLAVLALTGCTITPNTPTDNEWLRQMDSAIGRSLQNRNRPPTAQETVQAKIQWLEQRLAEQQNHVERLRVGNTNDTPLQQRQQLEKELLRALKVQHDLTTALDQQRRVLATLQ